MSEDQIYREKLLEIFRNPPNKGKLDHPDLQAKLLNPLCGDEIGLQLQLAEDKIIKRAAFSGNGCAISQASASILASFIEGKELEEVRKIDSVKVLKLVGITPSPARLKCALLSLEVLKKTLGNVVE